MIQEEDPFIIIEYIFNLKVSKLYFSSFKSINTIIVTSQCR